MPQVDAKTIADCAAADPTFGQSNTSEPDETSTQPTASQAAVAPAPPAPAPPSQPPAKGPTPGKSVTYYVATSGSLTGDGSEANPFVSVDQARAHLRMLSISADAKFADTEIHIKIEPGTYQVASTILFTKEDSGTKDTDRSSGSEVLEQLLLQHSAGLDEQAPVDRLMRHLIVRLSWEGALQPSSDLLRRPI